MDLKKQDALRNGLNVKSLDILASPERQKRFSGLNGSEIIESVYFKRSRALAISVAGILLFISAANLLSIVFYWQWLWDPLDKILHTLGGAWVAVAFLYYFRIPRNFVVVVIYALGFVALVGVSWEFLEVGSEFIFGNNPFLSSPKLAQDILGDLLADLTGGLAAIIIARFTVLKKNFQK